jgi:uncharacterized membrane protein YedE/YeeE
MKRLLSAAMAGALFSLGLGISGMTNPAKVIGFLDVTGAWNPALAFVMAGAVTTYGVLRLLILRRSKPLWEKSFPTHPAKVDVPLVVGSALFGVGWGLSGYCPGPLVASLATGSSTVLIFAAAMVVGMVLNRVARAEWFPAARPN